MDGKSLDINQKRLEKLKEIFPEAFCEDKIDWEKLRATLGEDINFNNERYSLNWAGKSDAYRAIREKTTATLIPCEEESVNFNTTENIYIEGENLESLKVLQRSYFGKVKMIYIDPPYNTGNDHFIYPDKFSESREEYLKRVNDMDESGVMTRDGMFHKNSKENGHYHSNWLSMMLPRLFLARNLLRDDGVIFISIDDNEVHNLRKLCDEIFGEENFVGELVWKCRNSLQHDEPLISSQTERILFYVNNKFLWSSEKNRLNRIRKPFDATEYKNPDNDPRGPWLSSGKIRNDGRPSYTVVSPSGKQFTKPWIPTKKEFEKWEKENLIWWGKNGDSIPRKKSFLKYFEGNAISDILFDEYTVEIKDENSLKKTKQWEIGTTETGSKLLKNLFEGVKLFDYPKPATLIKYLAEISTNENDIILDFFSGSATTAHAVMQLNAEDGGKRKFILVQLPEKTGETSEAYKAGYKTIADIGKERIRRAGKKIMEELKEKNAQPSLGGEGVKADELDIGFKVFKLCPSNFKIWRGDIENEEEIIEQMKNFIDPVKEGATNYNMLYELIIKAGIDLNAKIETKKHEELNYYIVNDGEMVVVLDKGVNIEFFDLLAETKPQKVICLDKCFNNNDQLKTNTVLTMKEAGVEFKTI